MLILSLWIVSHTVDFDIAFTMQTHVVFVNIFIRSDMDKSSKMKAGTWSVLKQEKLKVKKADILKFEGELENETN